jgi:predicted extracellular nuclease
MKRLFLALGIVALFAATAQAQMRITEWMYNGKLDGDALGEFVEFTNIGSSAIDMAGWSFDDNTRAPGPTATALAAFGTVAAGESVILTDADAAAFRTAWGLAEAVKIIGGNANNLGRSDEINLYDSSDTLIDRLTYNDEGTGTVDCKRTRWVSGNILPEYLGANNASKSVLSVVGDAYHSWAATDGDVGNPGSYPVPEPASVVLALIGLVGAVCLRWWKRT